MTHKEDHEVGILEIVCSLTVILAVYHVMRNIIMLHWSHAHRTSVRPANIHAFASLINLNMPLMVGLPFLELCIPIQSLFGGNLFQGFQNGGHHTLQPAKVATRTIVQSLEELLSILLHHMLHIHLATVEWVRHLPRYRIVHLELARSGWNERR